MNLEEKLAFLQTSSMEAARKEGNAIIDNYTTALEQVFEDHKVEAIRQSETRVKAESQNAKHQINQTLAKSQLEIKRKEGRLQQHYKDQIFEEVRSLIDAYMQSDDYEDFLISHVKKAMAFAGEEEYTIYLNSSDDNRLSDIRDATRAPIKISREEFIGGIRTVIKGRNILIDNSFKTLIDNEYAKFIMVGGDGIA